MRHRHVVALAAIIMMLTAACSTPQPATPLPIRDATPLMELFAAEASEAAPLQAEAPSVDTDGDEGFVPRLELPDTFEVEPTCTPCAADGMTDPAALPLGQAGHYVNMAYGYWVQYPTDWFTGFGNRPVQVLFSDLDPGVHSREAMRQQGCLIEIKPTVNVNNMSLAEMRAQIPRAFEGAQEIDMAGEPGYLMSKEEAGEPVHRRWVYVEHEGRTYQISMDYAAGSAEACIPAWEALLDSWTWFEPRMMPYRNAQYGYSVSVPTQWYRFGETEDGIWFSGADPTLASTVEEAVQGSMLVRTLVHGNPDSLPLAEWLANENLHIHRTDPLLIDDVEGTRVVGESSVPGTEFMSGFYMGRLGAIIEVVCFYPAEENWRYTPMANMVLYSFSF